MTQLDKAAVWRRINSEGRSAEFNECKEKFRQELRQKGLKRKQATDEAWVAASAQFPPVSTEATDSLVVDELEGLFDDRSNAKTAVDLTDDVLWCYGNLSRKAEAQKAPNPGAWALLKWARANPNRFFEHLLPKAANERAKKDPEEEQIAKARMSLDEREQLLEQMARKVELEMAEEDRVIDCPSCDVRILLKKPDLQKSWDGKAELDWPPPAVCPPDHPNY